MQGDGGSEGEEKDLGFAVPDPYHFFALGFRDLRLMICLWVGGERRVEREELGIGLIPFATENWSPSFLLCALILD